MGFTDCDAVMPAPTFFSLPDDGDTAHVVFLAEPIPREETFRKQPRVRAYFPVLTKEGLQAWGIGSRLYRKLRDAWSDYERVCYLVTRVGEAGSTATTYGFKKAAVPADMKRKAKTVTDKMVKEFLVSVASFGEDDQSADDIPI